MGSHDHAATRLAGRHEGAQWEAAADALGGGENVRGHVHQLMGEELARAAHAALHFIHHQHEAVLIAQRPQAPHERRRGDADAALALDRLHQHARRLRRDRGLHRFQITEGHGIEALDLGAEAFDIFGIAARSDGRQRAPVEGALESDQPEPLGMAARRMIFARGLDGAFQRLGAGVGEEDIIREAGVREALGQQLRLGNAEEVGDMPELAALIDERLDQMGMAVAKAADCDARAKIEIARPIGRFEPAALASREGHIGARIGRQDRRRGLGGGGHRISHGTSRAGWPENQTPPSWAALQALYIVYEIPRPGSNKSRRQGPKPPSGSDQLFRSRFDSETCPWTQVGWGKQNPEAWDPWT